MKSPFLASLLAFTLSASLFAADDDGFVPLFNGKDLTGWHPVNVAADTFSVHDGLLVTTGQPIGVMATERMYENFIIELDWQHMKYAGNSGLYVWGEAMPAPGVPFSKGIEVQILDLGYEAQHPDGANKWFTSQGDLFPIWGATMTALGRVSDGARRSFPTENRTRPSPEWNHYRVVCDHGEIHLSINGKEVTTAKDCVPRQGFICLESEGSECHFKNIRLKELPPSPTPPAQIATDYAGFHQLFDGKGLAGWKTPAEVRPYWSAEGARFIATADPSGQPHDLWTEKAYGDFELIADWKLPAPPKGSKATVTTTNGGLVLPGPLTLRITSDSTGSGGVETPTSSCPPKTVADLKPGAWNRFRIIRQGTRLSVRLNNHLIIDGFQLPATAATLPGPIGLRHPGNGMEFANLFLKEL